MEEIEVDEVNPFVVRQNTVGVPKENVERYLLLNDLLSLIYHILPSKFQFIISYVQIGHVVPSRITTNININQTITNQSVGRTCFQCSPKLL